MNNIDNLRELEYKIITCNKEDLLDSTWLFNNIPWTNHDNICAKIIFDEPITVFYLNTNNYDIEKSKIIYGEVNNVIVSAFHGFGGNNYTFEFKFDSDVIFSTFNEICFAYSKDDLKERLTKWVNLGIKGLEYKLNKQKERIERIKNL